jgi:hypothetical protein
MSRAFGALLILLMMAASCHSHRHEEGSVPGDKVEAPDIWDGGRKMKVDTFNYPMRRVKLAHDEDDVILILPYTRLVASDSEKIYTVLGVYKGKKIGFTVRMPQESIRGFMMASMGEPSDNFLVLFQDVYGLERDKTSHFSRMVMADCLNMGAVVDEAGDDSSGKHGMIDGYKVFFDSDSPALSSECYFNISQKDHWIELSEEPDYREKIVGALSRK